MAEGWGRNLGGDQVEVFSAGTEPKGVHPLAKKVMAEARVDISGQQSKSLDVYFGQHFDFVITVCDKARETCPIWPGAREHIHWSFDDPAEARGTEEERLQVFRRVQLEIKRRVDLFLAANRVLAAKGRAASR
jgi:arsenate reductase